MCGRETTAAGLGPAYGGVLGVSEGALKKNFYSSRKGQHRQCQEGKSAEGGTWTLKAHFKPLPCEPYVDPDSENTNGEKKATMFMRHLEV